MEAKTGSKESQVNQKLDEQSKVCSFLCDTVRVLCERLKNVVRESTDIKESETNNVPQLFLVPLAQSIENNTIVLQKLKNEIDSFINRLEN